MRALLVSMALLAACGGGSKKQSPSASASASAQGSAAAASASVGPSGPPAEMVKIPGALLKMGSDKEGRRNQEPEHNVRVATFYIDKLEATAGEYEACVTAKKCDVPAPEPDKATYCNYGKADRKDDPINCISFQEAVAYCEFRSKRLPHEAEWELAARGTDGRRFPWGEDAPTDQVCWNRLAEKLGTCRVGSFPKGASPFGVLDMAGNVSEWTSDMYCVYTEVPCMSLDRVGRGGSWDYGNADNLTTTFRAGAPREHRRDLVGVRCARDE